MSGRNGATTVSCATAKAGGSAACCFRGIALTIAFSSMPSSSRPLLRVLLGSAVAAAAALAFVLALGEGQRQPDLTRVGLLREVFDEAAEHCYARFHDRVPELGACLAGAMQAHLQALAGADGPPSLDDEGLAAPVADGHATRPKLRI